MKNKIKSYTLFASNNPKSQTVIDEIRRLNQEAKKPLEENDSGDVIIAVGGDGTFIDAVTSTGFDKNKIYAGVHTGTLGFMQDISTDDLYAFIKYVVHNDKEIRVRKVYVPEITVTLENDEVLEFSAINEFQLKANSSRIDFEEFINGELLQKISGDGLIVCTPTGDTAYNMNLGGPIDFSNNFQLIRTLNAPIKNSAYADFIRNPIISQEITIILSPERRNASIFIDGVEKDISQPLKSISARMDSENFINKLEIKKYSKMSTIRDKILLGYKT